MSDVNMRGVLSDAKFYEGYSRWSDKDQRYESWDEATDRVIDTHMHVYQDKMSPELTDLIKYAADAYKDKYILGSQRALQFGGDQLLKHQMKLYNCFSHSTRFITSTGIKSFGDFEDGDKVVVRSHTGKWQNAVVRQYGDQQLVDITFKQRLTRRKVAATANHRWILSDGSQTTELAVGDKILPFKDDSYQFDWDTATSEQQLYWCYGYVYGDGSTQDGYSKVRLCGKDARFLYRFESFGWKTTSPHSINGDAFVFTGQYQKTLPDVAIDGIDLTRAFVSGYLEADGGKAGGYWDGTQTKWNYIYAKGVEAQNFIRDVFPVVGITINGEYVPNNITNFGVNDGVRFSISTVKRDVRKWEVESIVAANIEPVWCLEVEVDKSFTLEGGIVTGNCTSSYADRPAFFNEIFYVLLCGAGAGFSVQKHHVAKLPEIQERKKQAKIYEIPDSIEGWADSIGVLLSSYFVGGGSFPEYEGRRVYFDTTKIRPKNSMISGGFKAPGPEPLRKSLDKVEYLLQGLILKGITRLRAIDVYDIVMHIADAVLAGGVRRSATICLFSPDDQDMISAKTGNWFIDNPQRGRSNNSVVIVRDLVTREQFADIMTSVKQFGEPGFVFVESTEHCFNPCVEIGMIPHLNGVSGWQGCNLAEINGAKCTNEEEFLKACKAAAILGTLQAGYTSFPYLTETTEQIFKREALLGVSITGWMNSPDVLFNEELLRKGARLVKQTNREVAALIGINPAARTTCVKPSGNASVLLMTASGFGAEHSPRFIRNAQMNKDSEVAKLIKATNPYMVEDSVWSSNNTDYVISFPVIAPEKSIYKDTMHGVKYLEKVKLAQQSWIEEGTDVDLCVDPTIRHNVSNTVTVFDNQWDQVEQFVFDNRKFFAGISFLGASGDKDYAQAPFSEVITAEQMVERYGTAALFASGLVVEGLKVFDTLWNAIYVAQNPQSQSQERLDIQGEWIRRFHKFAANYFENDVKAAEYCLKDAYLLHKWTKIQQGYKPIEFTKQLTVATYTDIDTMGAAACVNGSCDIF